MTDLSRINEQAWNQAQKRAEILRQLSKLKKPSSTSVEEAAIKLSLSTRQTYTLIKRLRQAHGAVTALLPISPNGGRGKRRIPVVSETQLNNLIEELYLTPQKYSASTFIRTVRNKFQKSGMACPSESSIRRRLKALSVSKRLKRKEFHPEIIPIDGKTTTAKFPLDWIQIDHTPVDIIIVDPVDRLPIGRPYITVAIDVFSRCIAGFYLSLEAPSATSVGLCLTQVVSDKQIWLKQRNIDAQWPIQGIPKHIGVDNAVEFHSTAFERGCAQHGIIIKWRPPGKPQAGGVVERVLGTLMQLIHTLPGTTFSNPGERAEYDSDKSSCLTLVELERWLTIAITKYYHLSQHNGLEGDTPLDRYERGVNTLNNQMIPIPRDSFIFLIDFLPVFRRLLRRDGITIDHITYYNNELRSWIQTRDRKNLILLRRDPRDLSRIFVLDEANNRYIEVSYRTLSRPSITLWEHKLARKRLRELKKSIIDENSLFAAIEELRKIETEAKTLTRSMRRNRTRRQIGSKISDSAITPAIKVATIPADTIKPFENIEEW